VIYISFLVIVVVNQPPNDQAEAMPDAGRVEPEGPQGFSNGFVATCKKCGWSKPYDTEALAKQGLGGHSRFCKGLRWNVSPFSRPWK